MKNDLQLNSDNYNKLIEEKSRQDIEKNKFIQDLEGLNNKVNELNGKNKSLDENLLLCQKERDGLQKRFDDLEAEALASKTRLREFSEVKFWELKVHAIAKEEVEEEMMKVNEEIRQLKEDNKKQADELQRYKILEEKFKNEEKCSCILI